MSRHELPEPPMHLRVAVMNESERAYLCLAWRRSRRVHHWHWPKAGIVNCKAAVDVTAETVRACPYCGKPLPDSDDAVNEHYVTEHGEGTGWPP